jgi:uncharacterized membrane protein
LGQSPSAVLALIGPVCDCLDGRECPVRCARCAIRRILLFAGIAYFILTKSLVRCHGKDSPLALSIGSDKKGFASVAVYLAAIPLALLRPWIACCCYVLVALMWLMPDPRIERRVYD